MDRLGVLDLREWDWVAQNEDGSQWLFRGPSPGDYKGMWVATSRDTICTRVEGYRLDKTLCRINNGEIEGGLPPVMISTPAHCDECGGKIYQGGEYKVFRMIENKMQVSLLCYPCVITEYGDFPLSGIWGGSKHTTEGGN